ncbi:MAG: hypothetical protein DMF54_11460 [Acidobacteria bacterium]|nr:MAG: hypothetical protein DMF54_11460 [Acidobacteriota bacterium]
MSVRKVPRVRTISKRRPAAKSGDLSQVDASAEALADATELEKAGARLRMLFAVTGVLADAETLPDAAPRLLVDLDRRSADEPVAVRRCLAFVVC